RLIGAATYNKPQGQVAVVVTEYCPGGSVLDLMNRRGPGKLEESEIFTIFRQTCEAVMKMHSQSPPIAHRDLKVENILLDSSGVCKLCDFGSATTKTYQPSSAQERAIAEEDITKNTTITCRSPEMVDLYRKQLINEKVDI